MNPAVSDSLHIVCAHCQAVVRTPADRLSERPRCPRCRQLLLDPHPIELRTATFDQHITRDDLPVIVDFWAPWCGPCQAMAPHFATAAERLQSRARLAKVNSDDEPTLSARFAIRSIPTLLAFKNGREVARQSGAMDAGNLLRWVEAAISR